MGLQSSLIIEAIYRLQDVATDISESLPEYADEIEDVIVLLRQAKSKQAQHSKD